jgi:hypothetical protein
MKRSSASEGSPSDLRKDNGQAIRSVCREFIVLCRDLKLFSEAIVAMNN